MQFSPSRTPSRTWARFQIRVPRPICASGETSADGWTKNSPGACTTAAGWLLCPFECLDSIVEPLILNAFAKILIPPATHHQLALAEIEALPHGDGACGITLQRRKFAKQLARGSLLRLCGMGDAQEVLRRRVVPPRQGNLAQTTIGGRLGRIERKRSLEMLLRC